VIGAQETALPESAVLAILALVQGLTEFLPVSSKGHLVLAQAALGMREPAVGLDVALHLGTLAAVLIAYRRDVLELLSGLTRGGWREPLLLFAATLPAAAVGFGFRDALHDLFGSLRATAIGLCGTAAILTVGETVRRRGYGGSESVSTRQALLVGLAQACAILPGISRSGTTIAAGLLVGLAPRAAARFSFLLAIPTILGAAVLELPGLFRGGDGGLGMGLGSILAAIALAGLVGYAALRGLLAFLARGAFGWFAGYTLVLGLSVLAWLSFG
jgi:undecaprenyl-diphosphatase